MQETQVRSLGWEDPLEKEMATHSSTLAWEIPWMEEPGRLYPWGCKESDTTERLHFHFTLFYKEGISLLQFLYLFHLLIQTRWTHGFLLNSIDYDPFFYNIWIHTWPQIWSVGFPSSWLLWPFETSPWFLECFLTFWQYQNIPVDLIFSCPYQGVSHLSKELCFLLVENGMWKSRPGHWIYLFLLM